MVNEMNPNLYPPNGYTFKDRDGTRHVANSWKGLEKKVKAYRELNRQEPGDPWREINDQHCANTPSHCRNAASTLVSPQGQAVPNFNQRVVEWLNRQLDRLRVNKLGKVSEAEAARRAQICQRCPAQRGLNESCKACLQGVRSARKVILKGGPSKHQNLLCCRVLGEDCVTSVYLEQPPVSAGELPAECWRRAT